MQNEPAPQSPTKVWYHTARRHFFLLPPDWAPAICCWVASLKPFFLWSKHAEQVFVKRRREKHGKTFFWPIIGWYTCTVPFDISKCQAMEWSTQPVFQYWFQTMLHCEATATNIHSRFCQTAQRPAIARSLDLPIQCPSCLSTNQWSNQHLQQNRCDGAGILHKLGPFRTPLDWIHVLLVLWCSMVLFPFISWFHLKFEASKIIVQGYASRSEESYESQETEKPGGLGCWSWGIAGPWGNVAGKHAEACKESFRPRPGSRRTRFSCDFFVCLF